MQLVADREFSQRHASLGGKCFVVIALQLEREIEFTRIDLERYGRC